jgi:predicted transcriptional regulator
MADRAHLEQAVLHALWEQPGGLTARELIDALDERQPAMTTILTVLDRLARKGLVVRAGDLRPRRYVATTPRDEYIARVMLDALGQAPDRTAVLSRFLGGISEADSHHLRISLRRKRRDDG